MLRSLLPVAPFWLALFAGCSTPAPSPCVPTSSPGASAASAPTSVPQVDSTPAAGGTSPAHTVQPSAPTLVSAPACAEPAGDPSPESVSNAADTALHARAAGPASGGPRGSRPCEFRESVDTYRRQCVSKVNDDGSLLVTAKGTALNPDNGFVFTLHGAESQWVAKGTLNAFDHCAGPFVAQVVSVIDNGVKTYELRFKQHCMIIVR